MEPPSLASAEACRERGNTHFKAGEYVQANESYDAALELLTAIDNEDARASAIKCRLNKSACLIKLQGYAAAAYQCRAVIEAEPTNAKAHFRFGQAAAKLGDYETAQRELTESIKQNPSLKEPRELLDQIKERLRANPRLVQALADMSLVEERGLRALNYADIKPARQQLELLLKDARSNKESHWEARALLGLALLCEDEGECEAAQDYIDAARRVLTAADDRRAELYCLQTHAIVYLDQGHVNQAMPMLEGGLLLAQEMGEKGLAARFVGNLALAHTLRGDHARAIEYGMQAVAAAKERKDCHFEAVASALLAQSLRKTGKFEMAAAELKSALNHAEGLGYSHVICTALRQFALLQLESSTAAERIPAAIKELERCHKISHKNGLRRAACDDAYNMFSARLKYRVGARADSLDGLSKALAEAKTLQYTRCRVDILIGLALGYMRHPDGRGGWSTELADLDAAHGHLEDALKLVETGGEAHAQVLTQQSLAHLLRASADTAVLPAEDGAEAVRALSCAEQALCIRTGASTSEAAIAEAKEAAGLVNVAVAMLTAKRTNWVQPAPDAPAAATAAKKALERALAMSEGDHETRGHALLALASAREALDETDAAAGHLRELLDMMAAGDRLSPEAQGHAARGDVCRAAKDLAGALAAYKEALAASDA